MLKIGSIKAIAKLLCKPFGKIPNQPLAIFGPLLSLLFLLDDQSSDLPIASHHLGIDGLQSTASSLNEDFPDLLVNPGNIFRN
jgi:hypothetical protein